MKTLLTRILLIVMIGVGCKKESTTPSATNNSTNNNSTSCNFTSNVLVIDNVSHAIVSDSCRVFGTTYYAEHWIDNARTDGFVLVFNGAAIPSAGSYTAVNTISALTAGKVYVEYYNNSSAWQPASGTVTVTASGTGRVYEFCQLSASNGSTTKVISSRSTCN